MRPAIRPLLCAFCIEVMRDRKTNQRIKTLAGRPTVGSHMTAAKSAAALSMFQASAPAVYGRAAIGAMKSAQVGVYLKRSACWSIGNAA